MRYLVGATAIVLALLLAQCGGGGGGDPRGDPPGHPLEGTWSGSLFEIGWFTFRVDGWGDVAVLEAGGFNSSVLTFEGAGAAIFQPVDPPILTFTGGTVVPGTDPPRIVLDTEEIGPVQFAFLLDAEQKHGGLVPLTFLFEIVPFGSFERNAGIRPVYYGPDIQGSYTGYGYAYHQPDLDFATFSPVTAAATESTPYDRFTVTLPTATFTGDLDGGLLSINLWAGVVDGTGARFLAVLSYDKQFVTVLAAPATVTGAHDFSYYALNRD